MTKLYVSAVCNSIYFVKAAAVLTQRKKNYKYYKAVVCLRKQVNLQSQFTSMWVQTHMSAMTKDNTSKYECCCKEATNSKTRMLHTHLPPGSTEDSHSRLESSIQHLSSCLPFCSWDMILINGQKSDFAEHYDVTVKLTSDLSSLHHFILSDICVEILS